jgi:hypothetical protein
MTLPMCLNRTTKNHEFEIIWKGLVPTSHADPGKGGKKTEKIKKIINEENFQRIHLTSDI